MQVQRGISLHNALLFEDETLTSLVDKKENRGRSASLISQRNNFVFHRFFFKSKIERKVYPDILKELEAETYISTITLAEIIQDNASEIRALKTNPPTLEYLQHEWPHINW